MGGDKLLMDYQGKPMLQRALGLLSSMPADEKIVVSTWERLRKVTMPRGVTALINMTPEEGISGSVRMGIINSTGSHFMFLNADQPELTADDIIPLIEAAKNNPDKIVYPLAGGGPCNPVIFPAVFRAELLALKGDTGGRAVRDAHPECCMPYVTENPGNFADIDFI